MNPCLCHWAASLLQPGLRPHSLLYGLETADSQVCEGVPPPSVGSGPSFCDFSLPKEINKLASGWNWHYKNETELCS